MLKNQKGFSLVELVVAVTVILIVGGSVTAVLLSNLSDAKHAAVVEDVAKLQVALRSELLRSGGEIVDSDSDGDYLDELVVNKTLDKAPQSIRGGSWYLRKNETEINKGMYYLEIECLTETCESLTTMLDEKFDGNGDSSTGAVQWSFSEG
ncbi:MAG: type II secretion system GspH family protein [Desulfuromonas thiophila]|jgi:prepilin-type N-terminal cleavage/methylation domain-containing protein|nr:type II secretion system GspH family protein [Desulfuromonas thiophila]